MKSAIMGCVLGALFFLSSLAARIVWPPNPSSNDPAVRALEEKYRTLAGFSNAIADMEAKSARAQAAVWSPKALATFVAELPRGWVARSLTSESRQGITLQRYAFSKDAALRDFSEIQRVLKRLEDRPATRIDTITLSVNQDGKRFSTVLITATIPVSNPNQP